MCTFVQLQCCGTQNYTDWIETDYFKQNGIPKSCCKPLADCTSETVKDPTKFATEVFDKVSALPFETLFNIVISNSLALKWLYYCSGTK